MFIVCLMFIDVYWCLLMLIDVYWRLLMFIDAYWCLLMFIDVYWCLLFWSFPRACCDSLFMRHYSWKGYLRSNWAYLCMRVLFGKWACPGSLRPIEIGLPNRRRAAPKITKRSLKYIFLTSIVPNLLCGSIWWKTPQKYANMDNGIKVRFDAPEPSAITLPDIWRRQGQKKPWVSGFMRFAKEGNSRNLLTIHGGRIFAQATARVGTCWKVRMMSFHMFAPFCVQFWCLQSSKDFPPENLRMVPTSCQDIRPFDEEMSMDERFFLRP